MASQLKATYFDLEVDTYSLLEGILGQRNTNPEKCLLEGGVIVSDVFQVNATFIAQQLADGKRILLSHKPYNLRDDSSFAKEVRLLVELGYRFQQIYQKDKDGNMLVVWEAIR